MLTIDVNSEFLHLQVTEWRTSRGLKRSYVRQRLPEGCIYQHRLLKQTPFIEALREAYQQLFPKKGPKRVIMALPINQAIVKTLPVVKGMRERELLHHMDQLVRSQTATTGAEVFWDYGYLSPSMREEMQAVLVIAQQIAVLPWQQAILASGLWLNVVDIESYALMRAWQDEFSHRNSSQLSSQTVAIALLRQEQITLIAFTLSQGLLYARCAPLNETANDAENIMLQLFKGMQLTHELGEIPTLYLCGELTNLEMVEALTRVLSITVESVADPLSFLSAGLALWEKKNEVDSV